MGDLVQLDAGTIVDDQWHIDVKLGEGAFGAVYRCTNKQGKAYALKVESVHDKFKLLRMEVIVLSELAAQKSRHFCKIKDKGQVHGKFYYVVMTLVGKSLQDLRLEMPLQRFSIGTSLGIAIQCLEALEDLHSIGYLHRDIKPGNYTIGRPEVYEFRKVYLLDFGMARKFIHDDGTIKKPRTIAGFRGTVRYAPLSCHINRELCRKDDLESWLYMVAEFTRGALPWRNIVDQTEIGRMKKDCRKEKGLNKLFGSCPRRFIDILRLIDSCKFFDAPDYAKIQALLKKAMLETHTKETPYDWELLQRTEGEQEEE